MMNYTIHSFACISVLSLFIFIFVKSKNLDKLPNNTITKAIFYYDNFCSAPNFDATAVLPKVLCLNTFRIVAFFGSIFADVKGPCP